MYNYITNNDTIIFSPDYNKELDINLLSNHKKIIFSNYELVNEIIVKYENDNLIDLNYSASIFNFQVNNLPKTLIHLTFGCRFNSKVNNLPLNLTHLTFGYLFNQKVNLLPKNLTYLSFGGGKFNQEINNLSPNLTYISFGFNQEVNNLPPNIKHLTFGYNFNKEINYLPLTITYIHINCNNQHLIDNLHNDLKVLEIRPYFNLKLYNLPWSVNEIMFDKYSKYDNELLNK